MNRFRAFGLLPALATILAVGPAKRVWAVVPDVPAPLVAGVESEAPPAPPPELTGIPSPAIPLQEAPAAAAGAAEPRPTPGAAVPEVAAPGAVSSPVGAARAVAPAATPDTATAWTFAPYGFAELNVLRDSTQSYGPAANNALLARPATYAASFGRTQLTANNSQLGVRLVAPEVRRMRASGQVEVDFFGVPPTDVTEANAFTVPSLRMRLFFLRLETPWFDLLAGQYHDLFGWGGAGFYPNTVAFLGVPVIYHRNPQLRASRAFGERGLRLDAAVAAVRPAQRNADLPDGQAGVRLSTSRWTGASVQGFGQPTTAPAALGLSGITRRFAVAEFLTVPGTPKIEYGWGLAANLFFPIIGLGPGRAAGPAGDADLGNTLSLTAEFSVGSGISDLYTQLTGGALFPTLPNPGSLVPPPLYRPDIDSGIVTFDGNGNLSPINWRAFVVGLQYHLPVAEGRLWVAATYARLKSTNLAELTPNASRGGIFVSADYLDGNVFFAVTPAFQIGASYQTTHQVFGDGPLGGQGAHGWTPGWLDWLPEGGQKILWPLIPERGAAETRNHRAELALKFFF